MDPRNRRALKDAAQHSLAAASYDPKKIILIHTGISVIASLLATVLNFVLSQQIQSTGGLSGLGMRSILSTAQSVLELIVLVAMPFWEAGYCYATLNIARGKEAAPSSLVEGFRRFAPLLRAYLLQVLIYSGVAIACFFLSTHIYILTPLADPMYEIVGSINMDTAMSGSPIVLDEATQMAIMDAYTPMLLIFMVVFLVAMLVISYRFRMVNYLLLENPHMGAREALRISRFQVRGHKLSLFKLDLSFLWFYILQIMTTVLAYGDYLLALFEVPLPVSAEAAFFVFLILSLLCQGGVYYWARNRVDVTYAHFYCATALPVRNTDDATPKNPWANM